MINNENLIYLKSFVIERNRIYKRKTIERKSRPWTTNPILNEYRFTNIKRWQDTESKWLIEHIAENADLSYEDKLLNCILFRTWNKHQTFEIICQYPLSASEILNTPLEVFKKRVDEYTHLNPEYVWYTNAFSCGGLKGNWHSPLGISPKISKEPREPNIPVRMFFLARWVLNNHIIENIVKCTTPALVLEELKKIPGLALFLTYQMYVDFTYIKEFPFTENDLVIAGPGCQVGIDVLYDSKDGKSYEEIIDEIYEHQNELFRPYSLREEFNYPLRVDDGVHVLTKMDIENIFCEYGKYMKVILGTGRPRNHYKSAREGELF